MKYRTKWNLGLLYKSEKDPQIEKDVQKVEKLCADFEKKYRGKGFTSLPEKLFSALQDYEKLCDLSLYKPWLYFHLKSDVNANDISASAKAVAIEQRINTASNKITFFALEISKIPNSKQKDYLTNSRLKQYEYYLERSFLSAKFNLSEREEQLSNLLFMPAKKMWVDVQKKMLGNQQVKYKKSMIPLSKGRELLSDLPKKERRILAKKINEVSKDISFLAEGEINAICNYRKIMDERRGFPKPYSATLFGNENTDKEIETFTELVTGYYALSHRFFKLQAKLLGEKKINFEDIRIPIGKIKKVFTFDRALAIARNALMNAGEEYSQLLDTFIEKGQIDVFPKKGKRAGGYCISVGKLPTFILMNQVDTVQSVKTLAHEMGHAIHSKLADEQEIVFYQGYSTATAEVASMFFEQFVGLELEKHLSEEEKFVLLHRTLSEDMYGIFRQIACFNFETELHISIRKKGQLSKEEIAQLMQKHMQEYCGGAVNVTPDDGYIFVTWQHIRMYFYTYSYAYGGLISRALFENWKKDHSYIHKVEQFLRAGKSKTPKSIFKSIGIDTNKAFFEAGLKGIENDLGKLEMLAKKLKKI